MPNENPVARVLAEVVIQASKKISVFSYRNENDFKKLWSLVINDQSYSEIKYSCLVIVADGVPPWKESTVPLGRWVSAYDWAVAFLDKRMSGHADIPHILILDMNYEGVEISSPGRIAWLEETPGDKLDPWIKIFNPRPESLENFIKILQDEIGRKIGTEPESLAGNGSATPAEVMSAWSEKYFSRLREKFCAETHKYAADPENHHNISNQVAVPIMRLVLPSKLASMVPYPSGAVEAAFVHIASLMFKTEPDDNWPIIGNARTKGILSIHFPKPLKVAIVDDRHASGFRDVLQAAIAGVEKGIVEIDGRCGIFSANEYDANVNQVEHLLDLTLEHPSKPMASKYDLLFLDLRLWEAKDKKRKETLENYLKLYQHICKNRFFGECDAFLKQVVVSTESEIGGDAHYSHRALALLPLIIAQIDPGLPIILFSSTQHRSVIQSVRNCSNIITEFSKPYIGGDDDSSNPIVVMDDLRLAVSRGLEMVEIRKVWRAAVTSWQDLDYPDLSLCWHTWWGESSTIPPLNNHTFHPWEWLQCKWLPIAQKGDYELAGMLPWFYITSILGETRRTILLNEMKAPLDLSNNDAKEGFDCLNLIYRVHTLFANNPPLKVAAASNLEARTINREIAISAGLALVHLIKLWSCKGESHA